MPSVELNDQEWQQMINILADRPFREVHVLVAKISQQLHGQQLALQQPNPPTAEELKRMGGALSADGKETRS
jgi:hypothetical protein